MRVLIRTIPRRAALAALAGLLGGLGVLALAAPGLADRHHAETLRAWLLANRAAPAATPRRIL